MAKISQAEIDKGLALFASLGVSVDTKELEETKSAFEEAAVKERRAAQIGEAEAVLRSLHYPHALMMKKCGWCNEPFQTNYCSVGMCSETCRKRYFEEHYKISYNSVKKRPWGEYEPPQIISSQSVKALHAWATAFIADYERLTELATEPAENPLRPREQIIGIDESGMSTIRYLDQEGSTGRAGFAPVSLSEARESAGLEEIPQSVTVSPSGDLPTHQPEQSDPDDFEIDLDF